MKAVTLTTREAKIFDAIWKSSPSGGIRGTEVLMDRSYADKHDGGPLHFSTVFTHMTHIKRKIEPMGITISNRRRSPSEAWRVEVLETKVA